MAAAAQSTMAAHLRVAIDSFRARPLSAAVGIRELLAGDPAGFVNAFATLLKNGEDSAGCRYILGLASTSPPLAGAIADPAILALEDAVHLASRAAGLDRYLDAALAQMLLRGSWARKATPAMLVRLLEILSAISDGHRIAGAVVQLLAHPNPRVRSKAALLVGRGTKSSQWAEWEMGEADARVRANIIEALWGVDSTGARALLRQALNDPNNRVAGNAAVGLYRLGDPEAPDLIRRMASQAAPPFRATAAWAMGQTADPQFLPTLNTMLEETEPSVRRNVLRALARIRRASAQS